MTNQLTLSDCTLVAAVLTLVYLIPPAETAAQDRPPWEPPGLVRTIGSPNGHHWWAVYSLSLSQDGALLASGGGDRNVFAWSTTDLAPQAAATDLSSTVHAVAWHPDGQHIAVGQGNGRLNILRRKGNRFVEVHRLTGHPGRFLEVRFARDGKRLIAGTSHRIHIYAMGGPLPLEEYVLPVADAWTYDMTPRGDRLVVGGRTLDVWDLGARPPRKLASESVRPLAVAISPAGKQVAYGGFSSDQQLKVWQLEDGELGAPLRWDVAAPGGVRILRFSPTGEALFASTGSDCSAEIWRLAAEGPQSVAQVPGTPGSVTAMSVFPNGKRIALGHHDHTLRIYDVHASDERAWSVREITSSRQANRIRPARFFDFDQSWQQLITGAPSTIQTIPLALGQASHAAFERPPATFPEKWRLSPQGDRVAILHVPVPRDDPADPSTAGRSIEVRKLDGTLVTRLEGGFSALAWHPQGSEIATGDRDGKLQRFGLGGALLDTESVTEGVVLALQYAPRADALYGVTELRDELAAFSGQLVRWNLDGSGAPTHSWQLPHDAKIDEVVIAPGVPRLAVRQRNGPIHVCQLTGQELKLQTVIHEHGQTFMDTFSPDGRLLAMHTWGSPEDHVVLWDIVREAVHQKWPLLGHTYGVRFSPQGDLIGTANLNNTLSLLRVKPPPQADEAPRAEAKTWVPPGAPPARKSLLDEPPEARERFEKLQAEYRDAVTTYRARANKPGKQAPLEELPYLAYARRFWELAVEVPRTAVARDALIATCRTSLVAGVPDQNRRLRKFHQQASKILLADYFYAPELQQVVSTLCWNSAAPDVTARQLIKYHELPQVQAHAHLALARFHRNKLYRQSSAAQRKVALDLYQVLIQRYGDAHTFPGGPSFREVAQREMANWEQ